MAGACEATFKFESFIQLRGTPYLWRESRIGKGDVAWAGYLYGVTLSSYFVVKFPDLDLFKLFPSSIIHDWGIQC